MPHEGSNLTEEKTMEAVKLLADLYTSELAIATNLWSLGKRRRKARLYRPIARALLG